jgi:hypothetical protein
MGLMKILSKQGRVCGSPKPNRGLCTPSIGGTVLINPALAQEAGGRRSAREVDRSRECVPSLETSQSLSSSNPTTCVDSITANRTIGAFPDQIRRGKLLQRVPGHHWSRGLQVRA